MKSGRPGIWLSLAIFAGWILITAFFERLWQPVHVAQPLGDSVSHQISPGIAAALFFLLAMIAAFGWNDIGLNLPRSLRSMASLWFPALYISLFAVLGFVRGYPASPNLAIILVNTAMVGFSEEIACRGVLYAGLRARFSLWIAAMASTALFGAVHVLNGFSTGDFFAASVQAITAFMTGIVFMGIRLRTGSLLPGIVLHWAWDFTAVASFAGADLRHGAEVPLLLHPGWQIAGPILAILPNFLYGLFLLRRVTRSPKTR